MNEIADLIKNKKIIKNILLIISIILIFIFGYRLIRQITRKDNKINSEEIYSYNNNFKFDYKVKYNKNKYIQKNENVNAYITNLISAAEFNLSYEYKANKEEMLEGNYTVVGKMEVLYSKDGAEKKIWEEEDVLIPQKNIGETTNNIQLNDTIKVDLNKKNKRLADFEQEFGILVEAKYKIYYIVKLNTKVENQNINIEYSPYIDIDLAKKVTEIKAGNNEENNNEIIKENVESSESNMLEIIVDISIIVIAFVLIFYSTRVDIEDPKITEYRKEINRILKLCENKIVKISNDSLNNGQKIIDVEDFGEIVKLSEELYKPILYYFENEKEEAWFSVASGDTVYRFIFKRLNRRGENERQN